MEVRRFYKVNMTEEHLWCDEYFEERELLLDPYRYID